MKKNYRGICLIGAGRAGMIHARNFQRSVPGFRIVSVADPVEEAAASACRELEIEKYYLDYKQALEDEETDAVVIVSPPNITVKSPYAPRSIARTFYWKNPWP